MKKKNGENNGWIIGIIIVSLLVIFSNMVDNDRDYYETDDNEYQYSRRVFSVIASSENEVLDTKIKEFAMKNDLKIDIVYDDTLKITKRLNRGEKFDAVWLSNSIWMYAVDSNKVKISDTKSTSINPIVFGIRKNKANELGFVDKTVYTKDIVNAVQSGKLKFSMSNPVTTNSGASAYLGILTTLAGNPEVLTSEMLKNEDLKEKLKTFFTGLERSSGDEDYLEDMFVNGDYEAVFTYESSIININKKLQSKNKDILYAVYPVDGVSISDSPIGYIDQKDENKKETYDKLVSFLLSKEGQKLLANMGRRTWYGGVTDKADTKIFNPDWGIDTKRYISPLKYPSTAVIKEALMLYQESLRKPVHVVFCLDFSGSMAGDGIADLRDAMDFILTERAEEEMLQFSDGDLVDVIPFSSGYDTVWKSSNAEGLKEILNNIKTKDPEGATALYPAAQKALSLLRSEDRNKYNTSVIVMTDGKGNIGSLEELKEYYKTLEEEIPIYSIKFARADEKQLQEMATLSNGKIFDGTNGLIDAFTEVRGYN
ncbi:MAG: VWA domain-containing protein [Bacilli bacterium]|nr:VWA domain-containing protein [Bacilli bacterium]